MGLEPAVQNKESNVRRKMTRARTRSLIGSGRAVLRGVPGSSPADRYFFDSQFHLLFALPWNSISGGRAARMAIRIQPLFIVRISEEDARLLVKCFLIV